MKTKQPHKNIRFWDFVGSGLVKLTIKPDQILHHHRSWHNGEGYSAEINEYRVEDDVVVNDFSFFGNDCDGRMSGGATTVCPLDKLKARESYNYPGYFCPEWKKETEYQRDHFAEKSGY
jgi:hypothetical protein